MTLQEDFRLRIEQRIREIGAPSFRRVSEKSDLSPPQVASIVRGKFDCSKDGPGIFAMKRLASTLGVSLDFLLDGERARQPSDISEFNGAISAAPSIEGILSAYERGAKRFAALERFWDHIDLYAVPEGDADMPEILRLGKDHLFAMRIKSTSTAKAQKEIRAASLRERRAMLNLHTRVKNEGIVLDTHFVDHPAVTEPVHVRSLSSRLGLRVLLDDSTPAVAVRCTPIPV